MNGKTKSFEMVEINIDDMNCGNTKEIDYSCNRKQKLRTRSKIKIIYVSVLPNELRRRIHWEQSRLIY